MSAAGDRASQRTAPWHVLTIPLQTAIDTWGIRQPHDLQHVGEETTWALQHLESLLVGTVECAQACNHLIESRHPHRIPPTPVGALLRAAPILAARSMWLSSAPASEFVARGLGFQRHYLEDGKVLDNLAEQHSEAGATYGALSVYAHGSVAMFQGQST